MLTSLAYGQPSVRPVQRDSLPDLPQTNLPTLRPRNDFYRNTNDPENVVRATLDNMSVMGVDPSIQHTMLQAIPPRSKNRQLPPLAIPKQVPLPSAPAGPKK